MMPDKRRTYTAGFKREAVHLVTEQGDTVAEAARNLGLNPHMLQRWKRELVDHEHDAFPGNGRVSPAQEELDRLQAENERLRMERDILKKAQGFFANESR
jgi:transposase